MTRQPTRAPRPQQAGFLLIEVLVSFLIFSVGVLALVGLQARMTSAQTAAKARADAAALANELIGVMWSDLSNLGSYSTCASYARCKDWQDKVARELPAGAGSVLNVDAASGAVSIQIRWTQGSDDTHTYATSSVVRAAT